MSGVEEVTAKIKQESYFPDVAVCDKCESPAQFERMNADKTARFRCVRCKREINIPWEKLVKFSVVEKVLGEWQKQLQKQLEDRQEEKEKLLAKIHYEKPNPSASEKAEQDTARYGVYFVNGEIYTLERLLCVKAEKVMLDK